MHTLGFMGLPGHTEVILIIFIILLLFGAKKLPELSRSLGKSLGEFKKGQKEGTEPDKDEDEVEKKEIVDTEETDTKE
jgi:sec-independent protein translocase protein TatA